MGLAAPQIGILRRIIVADDRENMKLALINPVFTRQEGEQISNEGCLSLPGYRGTVKRPMSVTVEALDMNGNKIKVDAEGFQAVVLCHEIDHLSGILYKDKAETFEKTEEDAQ